MRGRSRKMEKLLERAGCCESGINPRAVYDFVSRCEREGLGIDSFMLIKGGKVVAEGYHKPYGPLTPHVEFSLSKSIVSLALGFAVSEGIVSLDDSICKFFPEYGKEALNKRITLRHLVTMTAGKMIGMAAERVQKDWIKLFFDTVPIAPPGKLFLYVNDNFYLLSAALSRAAGRTLTEYLYPRLFEPLGIEKPFWETEQYGYAAGGWGLYLPIESLAKIMICCSQKGVYEGRQVIPADYLAEATKYQVPTVKHGQIDVTKGYGYGFWRTSVPDSYRAYGLYGQLGYVFENNDTVFVMNSGIARDMHLSAAIDDMFKTLWDEPEKEYESKLRGLTASLGDKDNVPSRPRNTELEEKYDGVTFGTSSSKFASMLSVTMSTVFNEPTGRIDRMTLHRGEGGRLGLYWREGEFDNRIELGMDGEYAVSEVRYGQLVLHACAKAVWVNSYVLRVVVRMLETPLSRVLEFDFTDEGHVRVRNDSFPNLGDLAVYYVDFSGFPLPKALDKLLAKGIVPAILLFGEPTFRLKRVGS